MLHCKHCGHYGSEDTFLEDTWEYTVCPKCGGEDIYAFSPQQYIDPFDLPEEVKEQMRKKNEDHDTTTSCGSMDRNS